MPTLLTIPYQVFEVNHVYLAPFQLDKYGKCMAQLSYKDHSIDFNDISLFTPALRVIDYHPETSRLRLDLSQHATFQTKLNLLYEYLINTFYIHQQGFLHVSHKTMDAIRQMFYFLVEGSVLSLYIYPTTAVRCADGTTCRTMDIQAGDVIRCVIRFQGISQLPHKNGMRLRLHHSVPCVWRIPISPYLEANTMDSALKEIPKAIQLIANSR